MDLVETLFGVISIVLLAAPIALIAGWLVGTGFTPLGSLVRGGDKGDWWDWTLPWPHGVQEEDGVHWGQRGFDAAPAQEESDPTIIILARARLEGAYVAPTRARGRIRRL